VKKSFRNLQLKIAIYETIRFAKSNYSTYKNVLTESYTITIYIYIFRGAYLI